MASGVTLGLTLSLGGLVSPLLGSIADQANIQAVFMIVAALLVVGFGLSFILKERRTAATESHEQKNQPIELESTND